MALSHVTIDRPPSLPPFTFVDSYGNSCTPLKKVLSSSPILILKFSCISFDLDSKYLKKKHDFNQFTLSK